ncbi:MAG: TFIIB-type zinc ribbon-containing protein [Bacilli bacterium]|nr:TFIIB-type zinc ribbon-containing protein [Bacilli bacterium]
MNGELNSNIIPPINEMPSSDGPTIVKTDVGSKDGQDKCPRCGSTDISTNVNNGKLRCNFCRHEFEPEKVAGMVTDISQLQGQVMGSGATDIVADTNDVLTFKCSSCGAEVVIDTSSASQARCHWCRNTLSVNQQIPNGSIPDVVLPFNVTKDTAKAEIEKFVGKRKFFAHPKFREEFTSNNIMGVYFPYMLVDVNAHANLIGEGEHQTKKYYRGSGSNQRLYYDADVFHVEREFDLAINGLSVESSSERLNNTSSSQTNNIINSIMPFDVENCAKYNANYLKGYTSERRDTNVDQLRKLVDVQSKDIVRFAANDTLQEYDRGVAWSTESLDVKGQQWQAAYLPVWLYSYQQVKGDKKILHYVAVNARTKETMGSVPIHMPKLILISILVEILGILAMMFIDLNYDWLFLLLGFIYFIIMYTKYRNSNARHAYEKDTKTNMSNIRKVDTYLRSNKGLTSATMAGANNTRVSGQSISSKALDSLSGQKIGNSVVNSITSSNAIAGLIKNSIDKKLNK